MDSFRPSTANVQEGDASVRQISDDELEELNGALRDLADVFPNIRPEVFREMLTTLSKESRAHVVAEHLMRNGGEKWIKGRWRVQEVEQGSRILGEIRELEEETGKGFGRKTRQKDGLSGGIEITDGIELDRPGFLDSNGSALEELVPLEETFRTPLYKTAVSTALRNEFRSLSKSTISAVLAEQNHCYTFARPILAGLAAKTWRTSIGNLVMRAFGFGVSSGRSSKKAPPPDESHYMIHWSPGPMDDKMLRTPSLRFTGSEELDEELRDTILNPIVRRRRDRENKISLELAVLLNEHEAELAGALLECQVCYADVAFEQIAACSGSMEGHIICFECIQRSVSEAVYGQSWGLTINHERSQVACLAPSMEPCDGCIPQDLVQRAVTAGKGGAKVWEQLQQRLSDEALEKDASQFVCCPFCPYKEIDILHLPAKATWSINTVNPLRSITLLCFGFIATVLLAAFVFIPLGVSYLLFSPIYSLRPTITALLDLIKTTCKASLTSQIRHTHLPQRFHCRAPLCGRLSCLDCRKSWRDPHRCHESAALSLRTTVEAARTAALKRTCPRCGVSFVKASGCNKMVCVCGYAMCYVCREGLKTKSNNQYYPGMVVAGQEGDDGASEDGYRHFCQHFRPSGGRCTECDRCDLYRSEDEDEIVRRAGERAEKEWRERNGIGEDVAMPVDTNTINSNNDSTMLKTRSAWHAFRRLTLQKAVDWWVSQVLVSRLERGNE